MDLFRASTMLLALAQLGQAMPVALNHFKRQITNDTSSIANQTSDFIIAGGGLSGLTVASRLSDGPNISVLIIEAGYDHHEDPLVYDVSTYGQAFNTDLDYAFRSTPIPYRNNETLDLVAGRLLGGSGSSNGASWTKGPKTQYDLLPMLTGDDSWSFNEFNPHMLRAEHFNPPSATEIAKGAQYLPENHGQNGPVNVSFAAGMFGFLQQEAIEASHKLWPGLRVNPDAASGIVNGAATIPNMLDPDLNQNRSSPHTAYILNRGAERRPNLVILTGHRVTEILWNNTYGDTLTASGVVFQQDALSSSMSVYCSKEVLLAAGSMQSPQLLELSGVGDPAILEPLNIPVQNSIPAVGRNFQEQTMNTISFPNVHQILGTELANTTYSDTPAALPVLAKLLEDRGFVLDAFTYLPILQAQLDNLFLQSEAAIEISFTITPSSGTVGIDLWNLIVLSRGSIHINSTNSFDQPVIEPSYFLHPLDLQLQTHATMQARAVYSIKPLSDLVDREIEPGLDRVPEDAGFAVWENYVKDSFTSVWHPIATFSNDEGGVRWRSG